MISPAFITEWSQQCPWVSPAQVEQDLVLSRGLVEIYSDPILRDSLLFRGGTALHKVVLQPAARKEAEKLTKILTECEEWERQTLLPLA